MLTDHPFLHQIGCRFWDLALREHANINKVQLISAVKNSDEVHAVVINTDRLFSVWSI
jgi:hypothetical protein